MNNGIRVSKNTHFLQKIMQSELYKKLKEIRNLPLIIAIVLLAICLLCFSGKSTSTKTENTHDELEVRLAETLSAIEGAGEVQCMIYRGESNGYDYWRNSSSAEIEGVIIVAEGAKDISVMLKLKEAATKALCVDAEKVQVYKKQTK